MITRVGLYSLVIWLALGSALSAKTRTIAIIKSNSLRAYDAPIDTFKRADPKAQYVIHDFGGDISLGPAIITRIRRTRPDLILTLGRKATQLTVTYFKKVPIIFAMVLNWRRYNWKNPNVTGISLEIPGEILFTQLRFVAPSVRRVGVFYSPALSGKLVKRSQQQAKRVGLQLITIPVTRAGDLKAALKRAGSSLDALWMIADSTVITLQNYQALVNASLTHKWPFLAYSEAFVRAGALLSVSPDYRSIGSQAAALVRQILDDGLSPSKIRVRPPIGTTVILNAITAKKLGLRLPQAIYSTVDRVIRSGNK